MGTFLITHQISGSNPDEWTDHSRASSSYSFCSHSPQLTLNDGMQSRAAGRIAPLIVHSRDASTSEDDAQKNRPNDELVSHESNAPGNMYLPCLILVQKKKTRPPRKTRAVREGPELQYLDLDLDSDNSSPRTPHSIPESTCVVREQQVHVTPTSGHLSSSTLPSSSPSKSTVYKTVDFVKTDALNTLRNKLEEEHRNQQ